MKKSVLVVAAHPDDEVLGCGGTIARHAAAGDRVTILILGEGVTSRDRKRNPTRRRRALASLRRSAQQAGRRLGAARVVQHRFPDNRFDGVELLELVKTVEAAAAEIKPAVVYTHHGGDLNLDHRLTHQAVLTAFRPLPGRPAPTLYAFPVPSSTEWGLAPFAPTVFVDIAATLPAKLRALACYPGETAPFPHPRSPEAIRAQAMVWGSASGLPAAEAFALVRERRTLSS